MIDDGDRELFKIFEDRWAASDAQWKEVDAAIEAGQSAKAAELYLGPSKIAFDAAGTAIQKAVDDISGNVHDEVAESRGAVLADRNVAGIASGIAALAILAAIYISSIRVISPIKRLVEAMDRLAAGDEQSPIPYVQRLDEIGDMARSLLVFQKTAIENARLEKTGEAQRLEIERERERNARAQALALEGEREIVVSSIGSALSQLAARDLTHRVTAELPDAYRKLKADFNEAAAKLLEAMNAVAASANAIRDGAGEISGSADTQSQRAEHQAASLEEAAASLNAINATVRSTSGGVAQARGVVQAARLGAEKSGAIVEDTVRAMSDIETSSGQMSRIIGVIDEIAFQTNLLALNAGVEAARAGDSGRGFAVVASEVRALAQRSAAAAKEIKELISELNRHVSRGVSLVADTGRTLQQIVSEVGEIDQIVNAIAASAAEQANGLDGVNASVAEMDRSTQQNAALSEEGRAASHALFQQTEELGRIVGSFRIQAEHRAPPRRAAA